MMAEINCKTLLLGVLLACLGIIPNALADGVQVIDGWRILKVKIVADQHFSRQDAWRRKAAEYVAETSLLADSLLRIRLEIIDEEIWPSDETSDFSERTLKMLARIERGEADAIIALTLLPRPEQRETARTDGMTSPFRGMMIKTYQGADDANMFVSMVMLHELVHLFGGIHMRESSLMTPTLTDTVAFALDSLNAAIVAISRMVDFQKGYPSLDSADLVTLTGLYEAAIASGKTDDLAADILSTLYPLIGRCDKAIPLFESLLADDPSVTANWISLANCWHKLENEDKMEAVLETALRKVDEKGVIYHNLAVMHFNRGAYDKARQYGREAERNGRLMQPDFWEYLQKKSEKRPE